ncbi:MAG: GWxTD domain-containing protein [Ignavibacteriaceae bacterium]|nr:GWxTD domain-containing protein [Ignavibacteriaceae bacterium]
MKKLFFLFVLFIIPLLSQKKLNFEFDYATFRYDTTTKYVEIYYSIQQSSLSSHKNDSLYEVEALVNLAFVDSASGKIVQQKDWKVINTVADSLELGKNINLIGVVGFSLIPQKYYLTISVVDINNQENKVSFKEKLNLLPISAQIFSLSDIQLASRIIQDSDNQESVFYKNTMEVIPAPNLLFGENQPVVYYYSELYNLLTASGNIDLHAFVYNASGAVVFSKKKSFSNKTESRVEVSTVNISKMPTGAYTLVLVAADSTASKKAFSSKKFFVYNPAIADTAFKQMGNSDFMASQFAILSPEECDHLFAKSKYLAGRNHLEQYKKVSSVEGKREFLYKFWKEKDEMPETPENETFMNYFSRVELANQKYSAMKKEGWKTDRGRVYLIYGEPSEIERFPNQLDSKPYEIWQYHNLEGGVIFVFADLTGFSDYQLINSTMRGELRDDSWQRRIITN